MHWMDQLEEVGEVEEEMPEPQDLRIYAAGKISKNDWRTDHRGRRDTTFFFHGGVLGDRYAEARLGSDRGNGSIQWVYVGPWFRGCDHGCTHQPSSHAATWDCGTNLRSVGSHVPGEWGPDDSTGHVVQDEVLNNSLTQIQRCDVLFARIDSPEAYGTFAEIGYAHALGKPVYLDIRLPDLAPDLWFLVRMSLNSPQDERIFRNLPWIDFEGDLESYRTHLLQMIIPRHPWEEIGREEIGREEHPEEDGGPPLDLIQEGGFSSWTIGS